MSSPARAAADPLDFRLRHLDDPRLRAVLERVAEACEWTRRPRGDGRGIGIAATVYHGTYVAHAAEVTISKRGRVKLERMWCAIDCGLVIDPNGVRNQTEGGIQQSASWTLLEELGQRDGRITTTGWDTYPIATFSDAPRSIRGAARRRPGECVDRRRRAGERPHRRCDRERGVRRLRRADPRSADHARPDPPRAVALPLSRAGRSAS